MCPSNSGSAWLVCKNTDSRLLVWDIIFQLGPRRVSVCAAFPGRRCRREAAAAPWKRRWEQKLRQQKAERAGRASPSWLRPAQIGSTWSCGWKKKNKKKVKKIGCCWFKFEAAWCAQLGFGTFKDACHWVQWVGDWYQMFQILHKIKTIWWHAVCSFFLSVCVNKTSAFQFSDYIIGS